MLLSFRLSANETIELFKTVDLSKVPTRKSIEDFAWDPPHFLESQVNRLVSNWDAMQRFLRRYGWHGHDHGYQWMHDVIAKQCDGNGRATFADFQAKGFRDLYVVATNISKQEMMVFNAADTPMWLWLMPSSCLNRSPFSLKRFSLMGKKLAQGIILLMGAFLTITLYKCSTTPVFNKSKMVCESSQLGNSWLSASNVTRLSQPYPSCK